MAKPRHLPLRTCVACRREAGKGDLLRVTRRPDGQIALDRTGKGPGRGAYLHASSECVELARKRRAIDRVLGVAVPPEVWLEVSNSLRPA